MCISLCLFARVDSPPVRSLPFVYDSLPISSHLCLLELKIYQPSCVIVEVRQQLAQSSHVGLLELKIYQPPCVIVEVCQQLATLFTLGYTLKPVEFIINSPEVCGKHHNFIKSCKYKIRIGNKHVSICNPHSKSPAWTSTTCTSPSHPC